MFYIKTIKELKDRIGVLEDKAYNINHSLKVLKGIAEGTVVSADSHTKAEPEKKGSEIMKGKKKRNTKTTVTGHSSFANINNVRSYLMSLGYPCTAHKDMPSEINFEKWEMVYNHKPASLNGALSFIKRMEVVFDRDFKVIENYGERAINEATNRKAV